MHTTGDYTSHLQQQGELRSSLRRTLLYRKGGNKVQRNGLSEQRCALESNSKCMQWIATTPIEMTNRTPIGMTPPPTELQQSNLMKSTYRMTVSVCTEKLGVYSAVSSTMKSPSVNGNAATSRSTRTSASAYTTLIPSSPNASNTQSPS